MWKSPMKSHDVVLSVHVVMTQLISVLSLRAIHLARIAEGRKRERRDSNPRPPAWQAFYQLIR